MRSERRTAKRSLALVVTSAIVVTATALLTATGASATVRSITDIHDERYCEVLEMKGSFPDAKVVVWNTVGLNKCPPKKWEPLDAAEIAEERGSTLVVLNGPRRWLMDAATGESGGVDSFNGLRMRRVAAIPLSGPSDLVRAPYTERTIARTTDWKWKEGRRVFELLAPDGATYLMQSYSQEIDPDQELADLKKLGDLLDLPQGWRYRTRTLKRDLTLSARGEATILQDDLRNTYQRLPRKKGDKRKTHEVDLEGVTRLTGTSGPGLTLHDEGTVTGKPFGPGEIEILVTFGESNSATGTFTIDAARGSAFGTLAMDYVIADGEIDFTGTASFTGGTGRYRGIKGRKLTATDHNTFPDGQNGRLTLEGDVKY